jgi:hypothetical protein
MDKGRGYLIDDPGRHRFSAEEGAKKEGDPSTRSRDNTNDRLLKNI